MIVKPAIMDGEEMNLLKQYQHKDETGQILRCRIYETRRKGHASYLFVRVYEIQEWNSITGRWVRVGTTQDQGKVEGFQVSLLSQGFQEY